MSNLYWDGASFEEDTAAGCAPLTREDLEALEDQVKARSENLYVAVDTHSTVVMVGYNEKRADYALVNPANQKPARWISRHLVDEIDELLVVVDAACDSLLQEVVA